MAADHSHGPVAKKVMVAVGGQGIDAEVVRLGGATVIPGLIDAHCHVADIGYLAAAADCGQPSAPGIAAIQSRLRQAAERAPDGTSVTGVGAAEDELHRLRQIEAEWKAVENSTTWRMLNRLRRFRRLF